MAQPHLVVIVAGRNPVDPVLDLLGHDGAVPSCGARPREQQIKREAARRGFEPQTGGQPLVVLGQQRAHMLDEATHLDRCEQPPLGHLRRGLRVVGIADEGGAAPHQHFAPRHALPARRRSRRRWREAGGGQEEEEEQREDEEAAAAAAEEEEEEQHAAAAAAAAAAGGGAGWRRRWRRRCLRAHSSALAHVKRGPGLSQKHSRPSSSTAQQPCCRATLSSRSYLRGPGRHVRPWRAVGSWKRPPPILVPYQPFTTFEPRRGAAHRMSERSQPGGPMSSRRKTSLSTSAGS